MYLKLFILKEPIQFFQIKFIVIIFNINQKPNKGVGPYKPTTQGLSRVQQHITKGDDCYMSMRQSE